MKTSKRKANIATVLLLLLGYTVFFLYVLTAPSFKEVLEVEESWLIDRAIYIVGTSGLLGATATSVMLFLYLVKNNIKITE